MIGLQKDNIKTLPSRLYCGIYVRPLLPGFYIQYVLPLLCTPEKSTPRLFSSPKTGPVGLRNRDALHLITFVHLRTSLLVHMGVFVAW